MPAALARSPRLAALAALALAAAAARAEPVPVRHREGVAHGFLGLRTLDGAPLADGELVQTARPTREGNRVSTRLTLRFRDGSFHEERTVYVQGRTFRLLGDRVVQRGPSFKTPLDASLSADGRVTGTYVDEDGKEQRIDERVDLPPDAANGLINVILKNVAPGTGKLTVSMVSVGPKPRVVKLELSRDAEAPFSTGETSRKATRWRVKVDVGGVTGVVASVLGKVPADSFVWILEGEAPAFVKAELALAPDGPTWRLEMIAPEFPHPNATPSDEERSAEKRGEVREEHEQREEKKSEGR